MAETPEQLAAGRGEAMNFLGRRITDMTGTAATSGSIPYIDSDNQMAEDDELTFDSSLKVLGVRGVTASTITLEQISDPGAASENQAILYVTNVSGSTVMRVRFNAADSQAQTVATEQ